VRHLCAGDAAGNTYVTGSTSTSPVIDSCFDTFVSKYDSDGNHQWTRFRNAEGFFESGLAVVADPAGNVYVAGVQSPRSYIDKYDAAGTLQQ
jgi:hypothetical protein